MELPQEIDHKSYDKIDLEVYLASFRPGESSWTRLSMIRDRYLRQRKNLALSFPQQRL